ncbi:MAG TPA: HAD family hydrolase [Candidatus Dormibacteraeota bacterium]|nr:HAD family hydrolase [Candidatus Dormibacteraeota bacterium]
MSEPLDARLAALRWVCLDVGETLIDETRVWGAWADVLRIPRLTMSAALGAVVERGTEHPNPFELLGATDWRQRIGEVEDRYGGFEASDLYPDVLRSISAMRSLGLRVAVLGNQPARRRAELLAIGVDADPLEMSEALGVAKPDPAFFARGLELMGSPHAATVAYVGDRLDNDVGPARDAGMVSVWLRRGPWGRIPELASREALDAAPDVVVGSLDELVERLRSVR